MGTAIACGFCGTNVPLRGALPGALYRCPACGQMIPVPQSPGAVDLIDRPAALPAVRRGGLSPVNRGTPERSPKLVSPAPCATSLHQSGQVRMLLFAAVGATALMFTIAAIWFASESRIVPKLQTADPIDDQPPETIATQVSIQTTPAGAQVLIDDNEAGTAPKNLSLTGRHTITARLAGYEDASTEIDTAEPTAVVTLVLKPKPARYTLRISPPDATVNLTPLIARISGVGTERLVEVEVPDGKRSVRLQVSLTGYTPLERVLTPQPGEVYTFDLTLAPVVTTINASATPSEAKLTLVSRGAQVESPGATDRSVWKITIADREHYRTENPRSPDTLEYRWSLDGYEDKTVTIRPIMFGTSQTETSRLKPNAPVQPPADDSLPDGWRDISESRSTATMAVITVEKDGTARTVGPFRVTSTGNRAGKETLEFNWPGSLWFMADGGSRGLKVHGTKKLMELRGGSIYEFDADRKPHVVSGQKYSVWISSDIQSPIYSGKSDTSAIRRELPAQQLVRLISIYHDGINNWRQVQTKDGVKGWMRGR